MSQAYDRLGKRVGITNIVADPNVILKVEKDRIQLGFGQKKKVKKTENAYVSVAGYAPRHIKEVKAENGEVKVGDKVTVSIFEPGDLVKITGITRGRGFAGVVKRWGFAGGPKTHGQSDRHRAPGSIGQTTTPGRVFRGKKMAGHMGVEKLTVINLEVMDVDENQNKIVVKGSIPGAKNGLLIIQKTGKAKSYTSPPRAKDTGLDADAEQSATGSKSSPAPTTSALPDKPNVTKESIDITDKSHQNKDQKGEANASQS